MRDPVDVTSIKHRIRPLDGSSDAEVELVARRMRQTLIEVLGEARGGAMYSHEWLVRRVRWHLDSVEVDGAAFVAQDGAGAVVGHTIVRVEPGDGGPDFGLFSTIYVDPGARRTGVASALIDRGERWMRERGLELAATFTDADNHGLHELFARRGYERTPAPDHFVRLARRL